MTPLRDKAIAAAARDLCPREDVCAYCLQSAEMAVDALLAAGLLRRSTGRSTLRLECSFPPQMLRTWRARRKYLARLAAADHEDTDA